MRWIACACLVAAGCFNPPAPLSELRVELIRATPAAVSIHGGQAVSVLYKGELPSNFAIELDAQIIFPVDVSPLDHMFSFIAPVHSEGNVRLSVYDGDANELVDSDASLLSYYRLPATPRLQFVPSASNFDFPVHRELVGNCSRVANLVLTNDGDEPFSVMDGATSDASFMFEPVTCPPLEFRDSCEMKLCYDSPVAGSNAATVWAVTTAGDAAVGVQEVTLDPLWYLATSFGGDGGIVINRSQPWYDGRGVARPDGNGIETWTRSQAIAIDADGTERDYTMSTTIGSVQLDWLRGMRPAATGSGIYALIGDASGGSYSAIVHLTDAGAPDASFAQIDLPMGGPITYYRGLELAGSRLLAIGDYGVVAISLATGQVDTTYGTSGKTAFTSQFRGESAINSQGQLYVVLDDRVLKLTAAGAIDATFGHVAASRVIAIDASDSVYVDSGTHVSKMSATGGEILAFSSGITGPIDDIVFDAMDRMYVPSAGVVRRYSASALLLDTLGYGTARSVVCPPSGGCYLLGVNVDTTPDPLPAYFENYVLRMAN